MATLLGSKTGEAADHPLAARYTFAADVVGVGAAGRADADRPGVAVAFSAAEAHADVPMLAATARATRTTMRTCTISSLFDLPDRPVRSGWRRREPAVRDELTARNT
jgi:hypothetical protein